MDPDAFRRARDALVKMWERDPRWSPPRTDEMLIVADALEEAGLKADADWLRESFKMTGWAPLITGDLVLIGKVTLEKLRTMEPPNAE